VRILFVYPNLYTQMGFNHGLASLSAVLKVNGHETRLVNLNENLPPIPTADDLWRTIREWRPGLIGFSCLTQQYRAALEIAEDLRARATRAGVELPPLVVGGIHPTMVPTDVMADGAWDHVGVGECEDALAELARRIELGESPSDVRNFVSWKDGARPIAAARNSHGPDAFVANPVGEFPDFARLPMPDYELFDVQRITDQKHGWFGLITSRGCPYRCTYCLNHKIVDRYKAELGRSVKDIGFFRFRPAAAMLEEVQFVLSRYRGVGTFILDDDLFTQNVPHALEFCDLYAKSGIGVPFVVNAHVKQLDERVAEALAKAGCRILKLGIESGSPRVRKEVLKRHMTQKDIFETVNAGERHGLHTSGFVMVGLPGETHAERWETVDLLAEARIGRYRTSFFYPFPGTDSYRLAIDGGYFDAAAPRELADFTEGSLLDFGEDENLFIDKLGTLMPWFVNSRLSRFRESPASERYAPLVERVLAMSAAEWAVFKPETRRLDGELAAICVAAGEEHYAIRYNAFMGVRSDFYLAEERGLEWTTAAAKPSMELREAARETATLRREASLAAAAAEVC